MKQIQTNEVNDKCIHFNLEIEGERPHGNLDVDEKIILK
jgi:hypothetical protein